MTQNRSIGRKTLRVIIGVFMIAVFVSSASWAFSSVIEEKNGLIESQREQIGELNQTVLIQNGQMEGLYNQIAGLNQTLTDLNEKMAEYQIAHTANLVTALGSNEIPKYKDDLWNHLWISGTVMNTGSGIAHNAGLQVIGYSSSGKVLINTTIPLKGIISTNYQDYGVVTPLSTVEPTQSIDVRASIFHKGTLSQWEISPVWTNDY